MFYLLNLIDLHIQFPLNGMASSCCTPSFLMQKRLPLIFQDLALVTSSINCIGLHERALVLRRLKHNQTVAPVT